MKHEDVIRKLSLEQKCALLSGAGEWQTHGFEKQGVPSFWLADGPNGLRKQEGAGDHLGLNESVKATCFPTAATVANSWDPEIGEMVGKALGREAAAQRVNVLLGPGLNMKRSALCGRNFEYFSEDPYLAGKMAASYVRGEQSQGIAACPKHFAVNSQETRRMASNSVIDERTLREIYLTAFEIVVKESHPKTIMTSYNAVNGTYTNESRHLLKEILRDEWGFDGMVVTDWGGSNDHVAGVQAGSSLEMPNPGFGMANLLLKAVAEGTLDVKDIDERVDEVLDVAFSTRDIADAPDTFDVAAHQEVARKAAAESIVLLKNDDSILPVSADKKVALIGDFAQNPRYQGAGSSMVNPTCIETLLEAAKKSSMNIIGYAQGFDREGKANDALLQEAVKLAEQADTVILCMGLAESSESEGLDRAHIRIAENQKKLLTEIAKVNPDIAAVISAGSAIETGWTSACKAVVHGYLGGQAGGLAMCDVLTGRQNPSGKLSETLPLCLEDTPAAEGYPATGRNCYYKEGLFIGYRYYDTAGLEVAYPFGYGLSYTTFEYSNIKATDKEVSFTLKNTGSVAGAEIAQIYISRKDGAVVRPVKELKGFRKVFLKPGEEKEVTIPLDDKAFRYFNTRTNAWEIEGGEYQILAAASSRDIRLTASVTVEGTAAAPALTREDTPVYATGRIKEMQDAEWEKILGHAIPEDGNPIDSGMPFRELTHSRSPLFMLVSKILGHIEKTSTAKGVPNLNVLFIYNMPLRALAQMTGGLVGPETVEGLTMECKGFWLIGLLRALIGFFQNAAVNKTYKKKLEEAQK